MSSPATTERLQGDFNPARMLSPGVRLLKVFRNMSGANRSFFPMTTLPKPPPNSTSPYRWLIVVLGLFLVVLVLYRSLDSGPATSSSGHLPKISTVPPFALTERSGRAVTNRDLAAKI